MGSILPVPVNDIIQYLNYGFIGIIALCALIGFIRGTLKSSFMACATLVIFLFGLLLMEPIVKMLINLDVSSLNFEIDGVKVESLMQMISVMIANKIDAESGFALLLQDGTYTLSLVEGIALLVGKIIYFVVLVVLSFTVYYFISFIIWLITFLAPGEEGNIVPLDELLSKNISPS